MLTKRIIPCLDVKDGRVVKGVNFVDLKDEGDPVELARFYDREGADELVFLDITASNEKRKIMLDVVRKTASQVFIPLTIGGGIRTIDDMREILLAGADKISINTAAVKEPGLIKRGAKKFGNQCIVLAVDAKRTEGKKLKWEVYINGGRTPTGMDVIEWVKKAELLGAGEILLTSMDADGTKEGYDLELLQQVADISKIPLIASGGAGKASDLEKALKIGKADAVLAASIFHENEYSIREVKEFLSKKNIPIRL